MRTYRDNLARSLRRAWISGLVLGALLAAGSPGCRRASPPSAASSPAPASIPTPSGEPVSATAPASAPAPAPASSPASATSLPAVVLPPGGLAQVRADAQSRREEARKVQAYRDAFSPESLQSNFFRFLDQCRGLIA